MMLAYSIIKRHASKFHFLCSSKNVIFSSKFDIFSEAQGRITLRTNVLILEYSSYKLYIETKQKSNTIFEIDMSI